MAYIIGEQRGTNGADTFTAGIEQNLYDPYPSEGTYFGFGGNDKFYSTHLYTAATFFGGSGSDTYTVNDNNFSMAIYDASGSNDRVVATNIPFNSIYTTTFKIDNKHYAIGNANSLQIVIVLDAYVSGHEVERFVLGGQSYSWSNIQNDIDQNMTMTELMGSQANANQLNNLVSNAKDRESTVQTQLDNSNANVNQKIDGTSDRDYLNGGGGRDIVKGYDGHDTLDGGLGNDRLVGGNDHDLLSGGGGNDKLNSGSGFDQLFGDGGRDKLRGGGDNDTLNGGNGDDTLIGGTGHDVLNGNNDDDVLWGSSGNDTMTGGQGVDAFVYGNNGGVDIIKDFEAGAPNTEVIWFVYTALTGFADVLALTSDNPSGHAVVDFGSGHTLTIEGVSKAELNANDFAFYP